jgi:hypothetical protein
MTAHDREYRQETPSMGELLKSCAAADAVSTPPATEAEDAGTEPTGEKAGGSAAAAALCSVPGKHPGQDAA